MVPIPSQVEVDLCRLEDYPLGPPRRPCSAGGKVAGNSGHDFRASGAFACWSVFSFKWQDNIYVCPFFWLQIGWWDTVVEIL